MITLGGSEANKSGGMLKAGIILFDAAPGTKTFVVPDNVSRIRVFVVGGGGGGDTGSSGGGGGYAEKEIDVLPGQSFNYVVGDCGPIAASTAVESWGGSSSFGGIISATGGGKMTAAMVTASQSSGGTGIGGAINTKGGTGRVKTNASGGGAGHRLGDGQPGAPAIGSSTMTSGGGFMTPATSGDVKGAANVVDGWDLGVLPTTYGNGGIRNSTVDTYFYELPQIGGGGAHGQSGGIGGGGGTSSSGGPGCVGVEVIG